MRFAVVPFCYQWTLKQATPLSSTSTFREGGNASRMMVQKVGMDQAAPVTV